MGTLKAKTQRHQRSRAHNYKIRAGPKQASGPNDRPLYPKIAHYWDKIAPKYRPLAFQLHSHRLLFDLW